MLMNTTNRKKICVFCGSSKGNNPLYEETARTAGNIMANAGWDLVYGGASVGLMGVLVNSVLQAGGSVFGVIPQILLDRELAHTNLTKLYVTPSMHERKNKMYELADAFLVLPGGMGTLDEICETLTWVQLGIHQKPCGILNINGIYDYFLLHLDKIVNENFMSSGHREHLWIGSTPNDLPQFLSL